MLLRIGFLLILHLIKRNLSHSKSSKGRFYQEGCVKNPLYIWKRFIQKRKSCFQRHFLKERVRERMLLRAFAYALKVPFLLKRFSETFLKKNYFCGSVSYRMCASKDFCYRKRLLKSTYYWWTLQGPFLYE